MNWNWEREFPFGKPKAWKDNESTIIIRYLIVALNLDEL